MDEQKSDADPKKGPSEEVKNLQRQNQKQKDLNRELMQQSLTAQDALNAAKRTEDMVESILGTVLEADEDDGKQKIDAFRSRRERETKAEKARRELADVLFEAETSWSDERLKDARVKWNAGDTEGALTAVRTVLSAAPPKDFEAAVEAGVQDRMKKIGKVDTGEHAGTPGLPFGDIPRMKENLKDSEWFRANRAAVIDAAKRGELH